MVLQKLQALHMWIFLNDKQLVKGKYAQIMSLETFAVI